MTSFTIVLRLALMLVFVMLAWIVPASRASSPTTTPSADPCLTNDPYNLAQFKAVISRDTPPTGPVTINQHLTVEYMGVGKMVGDVPDDLDADTAARGDPKPDEPDVGDTKYGPTAVRIFNTRTKFQYRAVASESMLKDIHGCHEKAGLTSGDGGPEELGRVEGMLQLFVPITRTDGTPGTTVARPQGWSNGDDSRIVRTPTTLWPWRTIAQSSLQDGSSQQSRCSFTLIGPRHLITAAHCIVNFGTTDWKARKITPGRDGVDVSPYGSSFISPNPAPGTEAWYYVPEPWLNPNTTNKWQWDFGLIVIPDRLGDQTGWMGYVARTGSTLSAVTQYNRGYPSCKTDYSERPAGCQQARLYGDTEDCDIGNFYYEGSDGWNRVFSISCDLSRGHSGSAVYHYFYDPQLHKTVPVVTAMVSTQSCTTCGLLDFYPNRARRITPGDLGVISWLRETFP